MDTNSYLRKPFITLYVFAMNKIEKTLPEESLYFGKKISELNIYEQRFRKLMQLMRVSKMLEKAEKTHKKMP